MLRITMMCVRQGDATIHPSPAKHGLSVVLLFPAVVDLRCAMQQQLDKEERTEMWDEVRSWLESGTCHLLVVSLGPSLPDSGLNFLQWIPGLIIPMTFFEK